MGACHSPQLFALLLIGLIIHKVALLIRVDDLVHLLLPDEDHVDDVSLIWLHIIQFELISFAMLVSIGDLPSFAHILLGRLCQEGGLSVGAKAVTRRGASGFDSLLFLWRSVLL